MGQIKDIGINFSEKCEKKTVCKTIVVTVPDGFEAIQNSDLNSLVIDIVPIDIVPIDIVPIGGGYSDDSTVTNSSCSVTEVVFTDDVATLNSLTGCKPVGYTFKGYSSDINSWNGLFEELTKEFLYTHRKEFSAYVEKGMAKTDKGAKEYICSGVNGWNKDRYRPIGRGYYIATALSVQTFFKQLSLLFAYLDIAKEELVIRCVYK